MGQGRAFAPTNEDGIPTYCEWRPFPLRQHVCRNIDEFWCLGHCSDWWARTCRLHGQKGSSKSATYSRWYGVTWLSRKHDVAYGPMAQGWLLLPPRHEGRPQTPGAAMTLLFRQTWFMMIHALWRNDSGSGAEISVSDQTACNTWVLCRHPMIPYHNNEKQKTWAFSILAFCGNRNWTFLSETLRFLLILCFGRGSLELHGSQTFETSGVVAVPNLWLLGFGDHGAGGAMKPRDFVLLLEILCMTQMWWLMLFSFPEIAFYFPTLGIHLCSCCFLCCFLCCFCFLLLLLLLSTRNRKWWYGKRKHKPDDAEEEEEEEKQEEGEEQKKKNRKKRK